MVVPRTGADSYLAFGYEPSFGDEPTEWLSFGVSQRLTGLSIRNRLEPAYELGQRYPNSWMTTVFEGTWSVEAVLSEWKILKAILGKEEYDSGTGQYTYSLENILPTVSLKTSDGEMQRRLYGGIVTRCRIGARVGEVATITLDGMFAKEKRETETSGAVSDEKVFTFADASIVCDGTTLEKVQSIDLDFATNTEHIRQLGNRFAIDRFSRAFEITGRLTTLEKDLISKVYGGASEPADTVGEFSMQIVFDNGVRKITFDLDGVVFTDLSSAINLNELILYDISFSARNCVATVI